MNRRNLAYVIGWLILMLFVGFGSKIPYFQTMSHGSWRLVMMAAAAIILAVVTYLVRRFKW